jgi:hypothetical protein
MNTCTCCGAYIHDNGDWESSQLCETCEDNQYATDRWSERESMLEHDNDLAGLDSIDYDYPPLETFQN